MSKIFDLVFVRKPNASITSVGTIVKFDRISAPEEELVNAELLAKITNAFFDKLDIEALEASEPIMTIINELKGSGSTTSAINDYIATLRFYGYDFLIIQRVDLTSDIEAEDAQARGYLLLENRLPEFSVSFFNLGWGIVFNSIPSYPVALQAIMELMSVPTNFARYTNINDNKIFFNQLKDKGQIDFYDNRDSEKYMEALGYSYLMLA